MTVTHIKEPFVPEYKSATARLLIRIALWQEERHQRHVRQAGFAQIPAELRYDIGLDGGVRPGGNTRPGRTFVHDSHAAMPERSGWFW
ncbi:MAG: hypothetical protein ACK5II_05830 [Paracoccus sp. (in: a-proteobacteria)]